MSRTKKRNAAMIVITLVFLGIFFGSYSQYQVASVPSMVYSAYGLTDAQFSSIMTAPLIPALFLSIVLGVLVDKYGVKQIVSVCMVISAIGLFIRVFATNYTMVFLGMALAGFSIA
ncbi:MFS transporter, partial [Eubacterium aggregans]